MLLYLFGNWCVIAAAGLLVVGMLRIMLSNGTREEKKHAVGKMQISGDLRLMLCLGAIARIYWSCSPPRIWEHEEWWIQYMSMGDIFFSGAMWIAIVALFYGVEGQDKVTAQFPFYLRWYTLTALALFFSGMGSYFLPELDGSSWPLADTMVVFNMVIDGFAMIPQMYLIANSDEKASSVASHFVGLMCLSRVFRMIFWAFLFFSQEYYILAFIIPDVIHSFIMGDYLYLWMKKVKKENVDPLVNEAIHTFV